MAYSNTITTPSTATATARTPGDGAGPGAHVRIEDLWYRYPGRDVASWTLQGIDLVLGAGELVGLLGPSGCGKTTLLRLIAGFERPGRGRISIGGRQVAGPDRLLPPERRGVGMVFQDDALFPHLDAWRNACFGLRRGQDTARVAWLLDLLGLGGLERRYPHELSGGQRQRLAMARALAPSPSVVLLDEPFSNLDVEVRLRLRSELPAVLARCGASGLMVTHDPEEALAICDRVGVLRDGVLHQCAPPRQLVDQPATAFVGQFVLQSNLLPARWRGRRLQTALGELEPLSGGDAGSGGSAAVEVMVRPQALEFLPDEEGSAWISGREFLGREWLYQVQLGEQRLRWRAPLEADHPHGRRGRLRFRSGESALLFPGGRPLVTLPPGRRGEGFSAPD
ncbi:spermidine/putrescine ABC transporter ATPase [Cyanobium sp. Copco_Reservoir_LC18]|uniref:ABC transporter ATP-binding protein n=1 Tax=Cyanobium sp. Copco_Reservoir_LC18 TaxID=1328305 RepID=UPI0016B6A564|nr:ABC transporter ATP-binding protein [Cyanobium sp. Copco_Reservoir_LC18]KAF0652603.1 spermidine/putrescine ABC transporter ATPase [Cyanobium sp. Copco_Reservoir_LC18]